MLTLTIYLKQLFFKENQTRWLKSFLRYSLTIPHQHFLSLVQGYPPVKFFSIATHNLSQPEEIQVPEYIPAQE